MQLKLKSRYVGKTNVSLRIRALRGLWGKGFGECQMVWFVYSYNQRNSLNNGGNVRGDKRVIKQDFRGVINRFIVKIGWWELFMIIMNYLLCLM